MPAATVEIAADAAEKLAEVGYVRLPGLLTQKQVRAVVKALPSGSPMELDDPAMDCLWSHPTVLAHVSSVLGPEFHLEQLGERNSRVEGTPGRSCAERLHADWYDLAATEFYNCVAIFPLDPFKANNGATRVVPGSHKWTASELAAIDLDQPHAGEERLTGVPGDAFVMNGHVLHAMGHNMTGMPRRAIFAFYCRNDVRYNVLSVRVGEGLRSRLPAEANALLR